MVAYHADAQAEYNAVFGTGTADLLTCLGMAIKRNVLIDSGKQPLAARESLGAGASLSRLYVVSHGYNFSVVEYVYDVVGTSVRVVAIDATHLGSAVVLPHPGTAKARGHARSR